MREMICRYCGGPMRKDGNSMLRYKYCDCHNPFPIIDPEYKKYCRSMMARHPFRIKVLFKCGCNTEKRILHHFDYKFPFHVYDLCHKCHKWFHLVIKKYDSSIYNIELPDQYLKKLRSKYKTDNAVASRLGITDLMWKHYIKRPTGPPVRIKMVINYLLGQ